MSVDHAVDIRRIITGLALAAALLLVLWLRGWPLLFVILLVAALGLWEFYSLFWGPTGRIPSRICAIALGWGMLCLTWLNRPQDALVCLGAGFVLAAMTFLFRWDVVEEENAFSASGWSIIFGTRQSSSSAGTSTENLMSGSRLRAF